MKKIVLITVIVLTANFIRAQEFVFPMYFEDALGNRDTVFLGYDPNGSRDVILPEFGELDIAHIPFDSVFDVRITNQADINANETTEALFHTKGRSFFLRLLSIIGRGSILIYMHCTGR